MGAVGTSRGGDEETPSDLAALLLPNRPEEKTPLQHLLAVKTDVQTFAFLLFGDAQADDHVDDFEDDEGDDGVVDDGEAHALGLDQDLGHIAFQGAGGAADGLDREHAGEHGADDAADGMHAEGVERVVIADHFLHVDRSPEAHHASDQADGQRAARADKAGRRGDGHQAGNRAGGDAQDGGFAAGNPLSEHPTQCGSSGSDLRGSHGHAGTVAGSYCGTSVEAEPAHPQQRGANHGQDQVVRRHGFLAVAHALAHHQRSHQTGDTGVDVHHGAASVVKHAVAAEEAATPHHVSDRGVHGQQPDAHEPQQGRELHAVCKRSNDQRRGDDGEGHLEGHIGRLRNGRRQRVGRIQAHAAQEEPAQSADEPVARRESQAVADDHPQHGHQTGDGEALHQRGEHVFLAHHAAIEQRQTGNGHHQHQRGGGQHPGVVAGVNEGGRIGGCSGRGGLRPGAAHAEQHRAERCGNCETFFHVRFLVEGVTGRVKGRRHRSHRCGCERPVRAQRRRSCHRRSCPCGLRFQSLRWCVRPGLPARPPRSSPWAENRPRIPRRGTARCGPSADRNP